MTRRAITARQETLPVRMKGPHYRGLFDPERSGSEASLPANATRSAGAVHLWSSPPSRVIERLESFGTIIVGPRDDERAAYTREIDSTLAPPPSHPWSSADVAAPDALR